jgi:archaemetzincin
MKHLHLLVIGDYDSRIVTRIAPALEDLFRVPCRVLLERLDPQFAFHPERQQYHSSEILLRMQRYVHADSWRVLGITMADLYIPILTFVFGEAQMGGPCGIVSGHRLKQEFYGLPADAEVLERRLLTEATHELGHTLHLTHCDDYQCAMAPSHGVEWMDLKLSVFCPSCEAKMAAVQSQKTLERTVRKFPGAGQ